MKKYLMTLASLMMMIGLMGSTQVGAAAAKPSGETTHAPPAISVATREATLPKLDSKRLSAQQLKGLKPASHQQLAGIKQLQKNKAAARAATAGTYYWTTYHYYGNIWVDRYYSGPYYSYSPWYPYYVVYDNFKVCTASGTGCYSANAYTYSVLP